jgi:CubicO group peptidase (beta-lactamase class C family)
MKTIKSILLITASILAWTAFVGYGTFSGFLVRPITKGSSSASFIEATKERIGNEFVGNMAMVLIENGAISKDFFYSIDKPVNKHTVFQMASVSKWITSWGIFALVEAGKINLDEPIDNYLTRWHLPESNFNNREVTVRNLLSHTSGLVDGLGYGGFESKDSVQSIEESLTKASDGFWSEGVAKVGNEPNSQYQYSGAGYTILQLIIEEVSGQMFEEYMTEVVFKPLKMDHSTFNWSDSLGSDLVTFFDSDSTIAPHYSYTALAAASLYTCAEDLTLFLKANFADNRVLGPETIATMNKIHTPADQNTHGLGPMIFGRNDSGDFIVGHDGGNRPAINTAARINLKSKDGIIILETGNPGLATKLGDEWIFWKTGIADYVVIQRNKPFLLSLLVIGYIIVVFSSIWIIREKNKQQLGEMT